MPANLENPAVATGLEKVSFHSNAKERQCQRMLKLMLKILQARLQQYMNCELPDIQAGFRKGRSGHRTGKGQFTFQSQRKAVPKNVQTTAQLHLSHARKCSKLSKPGFKST